MSQKIYPRSNDKETVYLKSVITNPNIIVGDYTIYNDFAGEPKILKRTMFCISILSIVINCSLENSAPSPVGQSLYLTVQIIRYRPCQPTRFLFSLKSGD